MLFSIATWNYINGYSIFDLSHGNPSIEHYDFPMHFPIKNPVNPHLAMDHYLQCEGMTIHKLSVTSPLVVVVPDSPIPIPESNPNGLLIFNHQWMVFFGENPWFFDGKHGKIHGFLMGKMGTSMFFRWENPWLRHILSKFPWFPVDFPRRSIHRKTEASAMLVWSRLRLCHGAVLGCSVTVLMSELKKWEFNGISWEFNGSLMRV